MVCKSVEVSSEKTGSYLFSWRLPPPLIYKPPNSVKMFMIILVQRVFAPLHPIRQNIPVIPNTFICTNMKKCLNKPP